MVATVESAADFRIGPSAKQPIIESAAESRQRAIANSLTNQSKGASSRPFIPHDRGFITVEPDGRDDIGFRDRLRHAIEAVVSAFASGEAASAVVDRVLKELDDSLKDAEAKGEQAAVQIRIASLDVAVSDSSGGDAFASIRQFALEFGVVRDGAVSAEDTHVLATDGRPIGLSGEQVRGGLIHGHYKRVDTGNDQKLSEAASKRLEAARAGLERVKAVQDALSAFRSGDDSPLRHLFEDGAVGKSSVGSLGQVFPGVGALSFR